MTDVSSSRHLWWAVQACCDTGNFLWLKPYPNDNVYIPWKWSPYHSWFASGFAWCLGHAITYHRAHFRISTYIVFLQVLTSSYREPQNTSKILFFFVTCVRERLLEPQSALRRCYLRIRGRLYRRPRKNILQQQHCGIFRVISKEHVRDEVIVGDGLTLTIHRDISLHFRHTPL